MYILNSLSNTLFVDWLDSSNADMPSCRYLLLCLMILIYWITSNPSAKRQDLPDINECTVNGTCDHMCINTPGSYYCQCSDGYQLYGGSKCADINECADNNGGCQNGCENTIGSYKCTCKPGFKLHANKKDCIETWRCIDLKTPINTVMRSIILANRNRQVILQCRDPYSRFIGTNQNKVVYECGQNTGYLWNFERVNTTMTSCSKSIRPPSFKRKARFVFIMDECSFHRQALEVLKTNLTEFLNEQKKFKCSHKCSINYLQLNCGSRRKKFRNMVRGTFKSLITAEFELQMDSRKHSKNCDFECMSKRTQRKLKKAIKILRRTIKKEKFTVRYEGFNYEVIRKSFKADKQYDMTCKHGSILKNNICIACSIGTYMSKDEKKCLPCQSGTFQDEEGRTECKKCPSKIPNSGVEGAANALQCLELCEPGYYSEEGLKPCKPCEIGKYQPQYGRTMCMPCGPGLLTRKTAASHFRDCTTKEICEKGYFYNLRKQRCEECKHGTYQPNSGENFCIPCPVGTTTDFRAATDSSNCKNRRCGGYRGYYQGVIETPNYPGNYPINVGCTWKIKPEKHRRILIIIPQIELEANGKCGDRLVIRKSKSDESQNTFDTCRSQVRPVAFTTRSKKIWINFRSNNNNTAKGFSIPFVTYHEQYQSLIEDIVQDKKLYNSKQHQQIFQDRKILKALLEVIAQPYNYLKYANVSHTMFPRSFFRLLKPKVRKFFST